MRVIFVGGAQRSGTTVFQTMLANCLPDTPLLPEEHILYDFLLAYRRAQEDWHKTSRFYSTKADLKVFFEGITQAYLSNLADKYSEAHFLLLKNPNLARVLPQIKELYPRSVKIICIRDPRDIVASFLKIGERQAKSGIDTHYTKRNIDFICDKIKKSYQFLDCEYVKGSLFLVRYERFVNEPEQVLDELGAAMNIDIRIQGIASARWLDAESRHQDSWVTELEENQPSRASVGNYREYLTNKEREKVEAACAKLMQLLNY